MRIEYNGIAPKCHGSVFLAEGAMVIGDVEIGEESSVWFHTVVRGDIQRIRIGRRTNVQDHCTLHVTRKDPLVVGNEVTIGHGAVVHGCTVGDVSLIGIGAVVLDGAIIGRGSVIGAGTVVAPGTVVPAHSLVLGVPGKVVRDLGPGSGDGNRVTAANYVELARAYQKG
jgi:carbonic anhydrase/acetyltransferase-like protein (isoleucine patch superfamily)